MDKDRRKISESRLGQVKPVDRLRDIITLISGEKDN